MLEMNLEIQIFKCQRTKFVFKNQAFYKNRLYQVKLIKKVNPLKTNEEPEFEKCDEFNLLSSAFSEAISKSKSLETCMDRSYPLLKETYLRSLLLGEENDIPGIPKIAAEMDDKLNKPYFCVLAFKIDQYQLFQKANKSNDQALCRFALCNIANELLGKLCLNDVLVMGKDEIDVILYLDNDNLPDNTILMLNELQNIVKNNFSFSFSIGIGNIVFSKNLICKSYQSALEYVNYRLFYDSCCIIDRKTIADRINKSYRYPSSTEKKLIEAIQFKNKKKIETEINQFIKYLSSMSYYPAITYCNRLAISILNAFENTITEMTDDSQDYYRIMRELPQHESIDSIAALFKELCSEICSMLEEMNTSKNAQIIAKIQKYLEENYSNPNLSIEFIADMVRLSPGYLGKLFKSIVNISFNDYLLKIRLEKAKQLLLNNDIPINKISENVGILNYTYFFTLFKKVYGLTPAQYRNKL